VQKNNFRRLLKTVESLADLGPQMTAERDFSQTAQAMVAGIMQASGAREAVLFAFSSKPTMLTSVASAGFALMPEPAIIPLLPKHVHALQTARGPVILATVAYDTYLSANGNVAPELFRCIAPLKVNGKLVGAAALGHHEEDATYAEDEIYALDLLCHYIALAIQNQALGQTLAQRVSTSLDPEEFREMADHTVVGHQIVSGVQFPWPRIPEIVRWHHERADGSGYPDGLRMDDVDMQVRIIGLADTFDAMTSERPYREPISVGSSLSEIVRLTPQKFDPHAVQGLLLQVRRDSVGSNRVPFLQDRISANIAPADVDHLAANVQHRLTQGKRYLT